MAPEDHESEQRASIQSSGTRISRATAYSLVGAALGLGAPVGYLVLRRLFAPPRPWGASLRAELGAYAYMAIATPIAFGLLGRILGTRQDELRRTHLHLGRLRGEEFAAVVAHDLRTPISAILLSLDLLLEDVRDGTATVPAETLRRLHRGGQRLNLMVNDLLDASRIEAARLKLSPEPTALPDAVTALVDRIRPTVGNHPVEIVVEDSPNAVLVDPTRLDQIVTNLVENAAKYSRDGTPIWLEIRPDRAGVTLAVKDQGSGIAAVEMPHLFDRFYQTTRARQKKSGLGLGLYITKGLVEAHGGKITVESKVDRGSTFSVWLPAAPIETARPRST